jgi:phosphatidylserine decarboxylase
MVKEINVKQQGLWMPSNPKVAILYLKRLREQIKDKKEKKLKTAAPEVIKYKPVIQKFKNLIDDDPVIRMYFTQMIDQVPGYYRQKDTEGFYLESIEEMLDMFNEILGQAPEYNKTGLVGFPINLILDWTMGMPAGFSVFRIESLNAMLKEILDGWCSYLDSKDSVKVLNTSDKGWMCEDAKNQLDMDQYIYDPSDAHWGFKSWNKFFTRELAKNEDGSYKKHPIAEPHNNKVIVSACDSEIYAIKHKVKEFDWFWVKSQPYSLKDMLAKDEKDDRDENYKEYVKPFIGGSVFQAFLSATKYHRWHSPVTGTIKKAYVKQGTYYSQTESEGMDPAGPNDSQGYITHVATRAIIYIEAEDPTIGLMCVMPVGMAEVSSCVIDKKIQPGYKITKGEELGYFQYGGSTHCLVFRPGAIKSFKYEEEKEKGENPNPEIKMGEWFATAN